MISLLKPLSSLQRYAAIGMAIALVAAIGWGLRVDHLRAGYEAALGRITIALDEVAGYKSTAATAPATIKAVGAARDQYRAERDTALQVIARQTAAVRAAAEETERQRRTAERNRELAEATVRQRDEWIRRAQAAETRTQRLTAEAELEECNAVLDALYRDGF